MSIKHWFLIGLLGCSEAWGGAPQAPKLTGVLYSDQGGVSATATGEIRLAVGGRIYSIQYQRPYPHVWRSDNCRLAGSIWTVVVDVDSEGETWLKSVECNGDRDEATLTAVLLVDRYLQLFEMHAYRDAYVLLSSERKNSHTFAVFLAEAKKLDVSSYRSHGRGGGCLEVKEKASDRSVRISAGRCYIDNTETPFEDLVFRVVQAHPSGPWEIAGIEAVPVRPMRSGEPRGTAPR